MPLKARLPHRLGVILPSLDRHGTPLRDATRRRIRRKVEAWFAAAFSGSTEDRIQVRPRLRGRWSSPPAVTVEEVEEVWAYCTAVDAARLIDPLIRLAESICREADQQAVAILVDSGMEIVTGEIEP